MWLERYVHAPASAKAGIILPTIFNCNETSQRSLMSREHGGRSPPSRGQRRPSTSDARHAARTGRSRSSNPPVVPAFALGHAHIFTRHTFSPHPEEPRAGAASRRMASERLWPILRDAANRPLLRMRAVLSSQDCWQMCACPSACARTTGAIGQHPCTAPAPPPQKPAAPPAAGCDRRPPVRGADIVR